MLILFRLMCIVMNFIPMCTKMSKLLAILCM